MTYNLVEAGGIKPIFKIEHYPIKHVGETSLNILSYKIVLYAEQFQFSSEASGEGFLTALSSVKIPKALLSYMGWMMGKDLL